MIIKRADTKSIGYVLCATVALFALFVPHIHAQEYEGAEGEAVALQQDEFYRGRVSGDPEDKTVEEYGFKTRVQSIPVEVVTGPDKGVQLELEFSLLEGSPESAKFQKGDGVILGKSIYGEESTYYISDAYRLNTLWLLSALFLVLVVLFARWAGIRSLVGLLLSFIVIIFFIVPRIADGQSALLVGFGGTLLIATASIFIAHGFRSRTTIAFVSTLITIFVSLILAMVCTKMMHLFGLGSEEAFYLQAAPEKLFNLRGILLAGIIIGTLGVLDDITTAQAAVVEELHKAQPSFSSRELFSRASSVGREHIISLVNTLVLAYTGASLPLLLLFEIYERPAWLVLNSEIIIEEVVRMLIGSIALILAVPLTTGLAAWYYGRNAQPKNTHKQDL